MWRRRRSGGHVRPTGVISVLVCRVLHLHQLPLGCDVAVAAGHQHGVGAWVANLLPGGSVIVSKVKVVSSVSCWRVVEDAESQPEVSSLPALSLVRDQTLLTSPVTPGLALSPALSLPLARPAPPPPLVGVEGPVPLSPLEWRTLIVLIILELKKIKTQLRLSVGRAQHEPILLELLLLEVAVLTVVVGVASQEAGEEAEDQWWSDL